MITPVCDVCGSTEHVGSEHVYTIGKPAGPCPSRYDARLGFPTPTLIPCGYRAGHKGQHHYEASWGDSAAATR